MSLESKKISSFFCTNTIQTKGNSEKKGKFKGKAKGFDKKLATGGSLDKRKKNDIPTTKQRLMEKRMRMKNRLRTRIRRRNHVSPKFVQIWTSLLPICHVRVMGMKIDFSISFVLENAAGTQVFYVN